MVRDEEERKREEELASTWRKAEETSRPLHLETGWASPGWDGLLSTLYGAADEELSKLNAQIPGGSWGVSWGDTKSKFASLRIHASPCPPARIERVRALESIGLRPWQEGVLASDAKKKEILSRAGLTELPAILLTPEHVEEYDAPDESEKSADTVNLREKIDDASERLYSLCSAAESLSHGMCETCGGPGAKGGAGWVVCRCAECAPDGRGSPGRRDRLTGGPTVKPPKWVLGLAEADSLFYNSKAAKAARQRVGWENPLPAEGEDVDLDKERAMMRRRMADVLAGENPDEDWGRGLTALCYPLGEDILTALMDAGADPSREGWGRTPVEWAAATGSTGAASAMMEKRILENSSRAGGAGRKAPGHRV